MYKKDNHSHQYFKELKDFLETQKTIAASVMYRKKLREHQDKTNYTNEIQRLRGELSRTDTQLPAGTIKTLMDRVEKLKQLGGKELDKII